MRARLIGLLVMAGALAAVWALYDDYGITWDEPVHSLYADMVRSYFLSGGSDRRSEEFLDLRFYGVVGDLLPSIIHPANDLAKYRVRHVVCGLFAVATLAATWAFAGGRHDRLKAFFSVAALVTMPRFFGHAFNNLKDIPFACAMAVFMTALASAGSAPDAQRRRVRVILAGLSAGVAVSIRPGGFPLIAVMAVVGLVAAAIARGTRATEGRPAAIPRDIAAILGIAWIVMVLPWPYAHRNPVWHPLQAMLIASSLPDSPSVLYDGVLIPSHDLPGTYLPRMLLITMPPATLLLALLGLGESLRTVASRPRSAAVYRHVLAQAWLILPLAIITVARPAVYDGIRHVMFMLPAIAVLAGVGGAALVAALPRRVSWLGVAAVSMLLAAPIPDLVRLHPYQTTYFNGFVGGLAGAEGRFDTDYWVSSYREAFDWVNERARREPGRTVRVLIAGTPYLAPLGQLYRAPNMTTEVVRTIGADRTLPPGVDFSIATSRWGYAKNLFPDAPILHTIGRDGAVFTVIRGQRGSG